MGELPLDIHEEILVRLKVKDLIRYKRVCKSWRSLISSRRFVNSHLDYNSKKMLDNNEIGDTRIFLTGPSLLDDYRCNIVGSSNGLVCVRFDPELLVINPSTHQLIKLKSIPNISDHITEPSAPMGFGYDSSIDDYKVVIGLKNTSTRKYHFLVLTLKLNVWRPVVGESNYDFLGPGGILCNGVIHWHLKEKIASFDLSKEVFEDFPKPPVLIKAATFSLGTLKDRLCFFFGRPGYNHELWVKKNYNVQESESIWERMLLPSPYDDSPHQTNTNHIPRKSYSQHIHIWMLEDSRAPVFVQSIESPHGKAHIWLSASSECKYDEHVFVESLVSPCGMGNGNGNYCNEGRVTMEMGGDSREKEGTHETNSNKTSKGDKSRRQRWIYRPVAPRGTKKEPTARPR